MINNIYNDNYSEAFALESFYIEEAYNQHKILNYINECVCLETGNYESIKYINESLIDGVKGFFEKIIKFFKDTFAKFRERMQELFLSDKKFLEKYKDIIINKPWKEHIVNGVYMYDVSKVDLIVGLNLDFAAAKSELDKLAEEGKEYTETEFVSKYLKQYDNNGKLTEINECIFYAIRGEDTRDDVRTDNSNFDKKVMYTFCVNNDATIKKLQKNEATVHSNESKMLTAIQDLQKNAAEYKKNNNESAIYSNVYQRYITEEDKMTIENTPKTNSTSGSGGNTDTSKSVVQSDTGNKFDQNAKDAIAADAEIAKTQGDSNVDKKVDAYKAFFKYSVAVQTAVMTVFTSCYKDWMKLLRVHVRDYVGNESDTDGQDSSSNNGNQNAGLSTVRSPGNINDYLDKKYGKNKHKTMVFNTQNRVGKDIINRSIEKAKADNLSNGDLVEISVNGVQYTGVYDGNGGFKWHCPK